MMILNVGDLLHFSEKDQLDRIIRHLGTKQCIYGFYTETADPSIYILLILSNLVAFIIIHMAEFLT